MDHCRHCHDPDDPRHADPVFARDEANCAYYEKPENLIITGPGRKRRQRPAVSVQYEPPSCGPQTFTS
jgi:hypothetical protein